MRLLLLCVLFPSFALSQPYTTQDLLEFLASYEEVTLDVTPDFVNYYQDIGPGHVHAHLDNLTQPELSNSTCDWFVNDQYIYTGQDLMLVEIAPMLECEGVVSMTLRVIDNNSGAVYERTKWTLLEYTFIEEWCACENCPDYWDVTPPPPPTQPYQFLVESTTWDLNDNLVVDVGDLLILLSMFSW